MSDVRDGTRTGGIFALVAAGRGRLNATQLVAAVRRRGRLHGAGVRAGDGTNDRVARCPTRTALAKVFLGPKDDVTNSVSPTKIGVDSCERVVPNCKAHCTFNLLTLPVLIWVDVLKRVLPESPP